MPSLSRQKLATFLVKYMLNHNRVDLEIIKDKFNLNDREMREELIRLFFNNRVFGKIIENEKGRKFLEYFPPGISEKEKTLSNILDWDLDQFNLDQLKYSPPMDSVTQFDKKKQNKNPVHPLFKEKSDISTPDSFFSLVLHRETNQKDLISIQVNSIVQCYCFLIKILIGNRSREHITDLRIQLNLSDNLELIESYPSPNIIEKNGALELTIHQLLGHEDLDYKLLFVKTSSQQGHISGIFKYLSNAGFARILPITTLDLDSSLPEIIPFGIKLNQIKTKVSSDQYSTSIQSVASPVLSDPNFSLNYLEKIANKLGFTEIMKETIGDKIQGYFAGKVERTADNFSEIFLIPSVQNGVLSYRVISSNKSLNAVILYRLFRDLQHLIWNEGILPKTQYLIRMHCRNCGTPLPMFPPKGEPIACKNCLLLQTVW